MFWSHNIYPAIKKKLIPAVSFPFSGCFNEAKFSYTYRRHVAVIIMYNFNSVSSFFDLLIIIYRSYLRTTYLVKFFYLFNNFVVNNRFWSTSFFLTEEILKLHSLFELEFI